jgi:Domain of unknown function (DUF4145)
MDQLQNFITAAKAINQEVRTKLGPPPEGGLSKGHPVVLASIVRNTRGYIERAANQANGCYENGWYDACAVMLRRLLETLIIETFEHHKIDAKIKNNAGDFLFLRDLIERTISEKAWNLSRNCKQAMPRLKDVGDKSAHSRRYIAQRGDIDKLVPDVRVVIQELVYLSGLK